MGKNIVLSFLLFALILLYGLETCAAEEYGLLFDIQGDAEVHNADSGIIKLKKSKHLLLPLNEGDSIKVIHGRVIVASMSDNKGYEIPSGSEAVIKNRKIIAVRGSLNELKGLRAPGKYVSGSIGGVVLRGGTQKQGTSNSCLGDLSPMDAYIIELTPELLWKNSCPERETIFTIKVLSGDREVLNFDTREHSLKIPAGVLEYGGRYKWFVDSETARGTAEGTFSIHRENEVRRINEEIAFYKAHTDNLPFRLSYVFYLIDKGLKDMARMEVDKLEKDFPDNMHIKEVARKIQ